MSIFCKDISWFETSEVNILTQLLPHEDLINNSDQESLPCVAFVFEIDCGSGLV